MFTAKKYHKTKYLKTNKKEKNPFFSENEIIVSGREKNLKKKALMKVSESIFC